MVEAEDEETLEAMDEAAEVLAAEVGEEADDPTMTNTAMGHVQPRPSLMVIFLPFYLALHR
jgi:hypothetical protein